MFKTEDAGVSRQAADTQGSESSACNRLSGDGADWSRLNEGLLNRFVTTFSIDVNENNVLYTGTEGGGVFRFVRP